MVPKGKGRDSKERKGKGSKEREKGMVSKEREGNGFQRERREWFPKREE